MKNVTKKQIIELSRSITSVMTDGNTLYFRIGPVDKGGMDISYNIHYHRIRIEDDVQIESKSLVDVFVENLPIENLLTHYSTDKLTFETLNKIKK